MPRTAPRSGYDFSLKRDYRRKVWATFRDALKSDHRSVANAQALLMPSLEGDEIEVALNAGFREYNLHVVDKEPAIVATLKRRYPQINTYGVTASKAVHRIQKLGIAIDCANFDFCGKVSDKTDLELRECATHGNNGAFAGVAYIAVSIARGREESEVVRILDDDNSSDDEIARLKAIRPPGVTDHLDIFQRFTLRDRNRILCVGSALSLSAGDFSQSNSDTPLAIIRRCEKYKSTSGHSMLWSVWRVESAAWRYQRCESYNRIAESLGISINFHTATAAEIENVVKFHATSELSPV